MSHDNKKLTRRQILGSSGVGTAGFLAGCLGTGGGGGDEAIHVLTDYNTDAWKTRWEDEIVPEFEEDTGHSVDIEYFGAVQQGTSDFRR